jgi:hypothetical protein
MIPKDAICKTCGWFDGDSLNPSRMGICSDPAILRASPIGRSTEVVSGRRKACLNWKPREGNT